MATLARRGQRDTNIWPGFVDALATLLMVIIFLLLVFVLAQFFLGQALSGRESALKKLETEVSELAGLLALEKQETAKLAEKLGRVTDTLQASLAAEDKQRLRAEGAEERLAEALLTLQASEEDARLKQEQIAALLEENQAALDAQAAALAEKEAALADKNAALADVERLSQEQQRLIADIVALRALKEDLEERVSEFAEANEETGKRLLAERELSTSARAEVALLNQQVAALRQQLASLQEALDASEAASAAQKAQIESLGQRLNAALASKVQELNRYRSEFFGRLREVLGNRPGIRIVGDRFVFQSEVLFDVGSAELGPAGQEQLAQLGETLGDLASRIPAEIDWVLRVDGHTDKTPISTARFPSNWELSSARAISVVKFLIGLGLPPERLVAAGFGANRPIDPGSDEIALRRNRRIELKLTQR